MTIEIQQYKSCKRANERTACGVRWSCHAHSVGVNNVQDALSNLTKAGKSKGILKDIANDFTKTNAVSFNKYTDGRQDYKMVE
mgnify:CR=1 FL=1